MRLPAASWEVCDLRPRNGQPIPRHSARKNHKWNRCNKKGCNNLNCYILFCCINRSLRQLVRYRLAASLLLLQLRQHLVQRQGLLVAGGQGFELELAGGAFLGALEQHIGDALAIGVLELLGQLG